MRTLILGAAISAALAVAFTFLLPRPQATAAPGKNLQVYPKNTELSVIKKDMKTISKALGVQCDYCHDLDAMDKDTKLKEAARKMMKMTAAANATMKKDGFKEQVTCMTCHAGQKKPAKK
jgi:hypothetical protein